MISDVLVWYLIVGAFGFLGWPIAFRFLPGLADRGYAVSRALGLLLTGYILWLFTSLGLLYNSIGGIVFSALIVCGFAVWAYTSRRDKEDTLSKWLSGHGRMVAVTEILFIAAFACWAVVRAYNPELNSTEKPMELTFLNGIRQSRMFPPLDPWLSGYSISYYYFGYVIMVMITELTNTATSVAFNLGIALLSSLTLIGSYGLVYNLVSTVGDRRRTAVTALIGPLFTGVAGNLAGFLELVRALNFPALGARFWAWLDIEDLSSPVTRVLWPPDQWRFWWWWRASRVIRDRDLTGTAIGLQPIDEFPLFSFLLGDMHPHVLALPFVLLALALALNVLLQKDSISRPQFGLYALCFGGLAFLNTWDFPIYLFILVGALALRLFRSQPRPPLHQVIGPVSTGLGLLGLGFVAYLPWYITFTSQAGGILPNAIFPTRPQQYFAMFGLFVVIIVWFLVDHIAHAHRRMDWRLGAALAGSILVILVSLMVGLSLVAVRISPEARSFLLTSTGVAAGGDAANQAIREVLLYRLTHPATAVFLVLVIGICAAASTPQADSTESVETPDDPRTGGSARSFVFLLILTGAALTLVPEFLYLRDVFAQRLNTVFKFYYAAWLLFSIASAYAVHTILTTHRAGLRVAAALIVGFVIAACLVYPAFAIPTKMAPLIRTSGDPPPTLDGIDYIRIQYPADYNGILWLQQNAPPGSVVLEAVGGSYRYNGRVSSATGLPTVIGWPGHEQQWRGSLFDQLAGAREADVKEIYNTNSIVRARALLRQYDVSYIFVGSLERDPSYASPTGLTKFDHISSPVFQDGGVTIYRFDPTQSEAQP